MDFVCLFTEHSGVNCSSQSTPTWISEQDRNHLPSPSRWIALSRLSWYCFTRICVCPYAAQHPCFPAPVPPPPKNIWTLCQIGLDTDLSTPNHFHPIFLRLSHLWLGFWNLGVQPGKPHLDHHHPKIVGLCHFCLGFWNLGLWVRPPTTTTSQTFFELAVQVIFCHAFRKRVSGLPFPHTNSTHICLDFVHFWLGFRNLGGRMHAGVNCCSSGKWSTWKSSFVWELALLKYWTPLVSYIVCHNGLILVTETSVHEPWKKILHLLGHSFLTCVCERGASSITLLYDREVVRSTHHACTHLCQQVGLYWENRGRPNRRDEQHHRSSCSIMCFRWHVARSNTVFPLLLAKGNQCLRKKLFWLCLCSEWVLWPKLHRVNDWHAGQIWVDGLLQTENQSAHSKLQGRGHRFVCPTPGTNEYTIRPGEWRHAMCHRSFSGLEMQNVKTQLLNARRSAIPFSSYFGEIRLACDAPIIVNYCLILKHLPVHQDLSERRLDCHGELVISSQKVDRLHPFHHHTCCAQGQWNPSDVVKLTARRFAWGGLSPENTLVHRPEETASCYFRKVSTRELSKMFFFLYEDETTSAVHHVWDWPAHLCQLWLILLRSDDTDQGQITLLDICLCVCVQYDNKMGHSDDHRWHCDNQKTHCLSVSVLRVPLLLF